ncbi:hypothetical protein BDV95DRAFT_568026 [Massariosphaeria phaeospora]|uniref:Uncharacterized protein n=1 Tax=Massariosphaeria phaeospora TaxID=100035 RepID=A0A7C8MP54_9PLEO|nr:hypothetical protein BDV95DRAFT_568026 [Massariosphaeria phaeospora]
MPLFIYFTSSRTLTDQQLHTVLCGIIWPLRSQLGLLLVGRSFLCSQFLFGVQRGFFASPGIFSE